MNRVSNTDVARFIWGHWCRFPIRMGLLIGGMTAAVIVDLMFPLVSGYLIDSVAAAGAAPTEEQVATAVFALALMLVQAVGFYAARRFSMMLWMGFAADVMRNIVTEAFHRVQRYSTDWHANNFAGATVRRISRGMWAYDTVADTVYIGLYPSAGVLIGVTISLFLHWPLLGLFALVSIAVFTIVIALLALHYVAPRNRLAVDADSEIGASLADAVSCNDVVKGFGAEAREDTRFRTRVDNWRYLVTRSWTSMENATLAQAGMLICLQAGLIGITLWYWSAGAATPGDIAYALTSFLLVNINLREFGMHLQNLQQGVNEIEDVVAYAKRQVDLPDSNGAPDLEPTHGAIRLDGVGFRYPNQVANAYRGFSLEISPGEKVALVGHSGAGKSTFVKLLLRLYDVDRGRILVDGQDISGVAQASLRRSVALVPQEPMLFHRSIAENIGYAQPGASYDDIRDAARRAHADEFIADLPQGYDTLVGERGVKLSGGERQRVAIARAILADAPILILDEATSSLDSVTESKIQQAIAEAMRGRTTVIVAHRLSTIRQVDRVLVFDRGRIVEQGTYDELLARPGGQFRTLHATQQAGFLAAE